MAPPGGRGLEPCFFFLAAAKPGCHGSRATVLKENRSARLSRHGGLKVEHRGKNPFSYETNMATAAHFLALPLLNDTKPGALLFSIMAFPQTGEDQVVLHCTF